MVLRRDYWSKNLRKLADNEHNYMVLDISHLGYADDMERLENSIYVLDVCNMIKWVNDFYRKIKLNKRFNADILFDVLKTLHTGEAFNDKQLQKYFKLMQDLMELESQVKKLNSHIETLNIPSEVEFILLGLSEKEQQDLGSKAVNELNSEYVPELVDMLGKKISVKEFLETAREMIKEACKWNKAA